MFKIVFSLSCIYYYAIQVENFSYGTETARDTSFCQRREAPTDIALSELVQRRADIAQTCVCVPLVSPEVFPFNGNTSYFIWQDS